MTDDEARQTWDDALVRLPDRAPFQTFAWGEYRRALGWEPCRWIARNDKEEVVAMMQASLRRYALGLGMVWCEGGPVGDLSACDESLQQAIKETTGIKRVYCRFRCDRQRTTEDALRLSAQGWSMSWSPMTTNYSMFLDLNPEEEQLLAACERNWRRNLRRAQEGSLKVRQWLDPSADEVLPVYASMQNLKGLEEQLSREEIEQILRNLRHRLVLYRCDDESGVVVSLLGCVVVGDRACAVFWATSEAGRNLHASYAIFWALVQHCRRIGVRFYDLAGIDPVRNHGVYRFKRATGAVPIEYLGEWDWASRPWMRWFGNWAIARRHRLQRATTALTTDGASSSPGRVVTAAARAALGFLAVTSNSFLE